MQLGTNNNTHDTNRPKPNLPKHLYWDCHYYKIDWEPYHSHFTGSYFCLSLFCRYCYRLRWLILVILAGVFVLTNLVSFCPLYTLFGLNTCFVKK